MNLFALSTIALKYKCTLDEIDKHATRTVYADGVVAQPTAAGNSRNRESIAIKCSRHWRMLYVMGCLAIIVGFFVITLIGCWKITCGDHPTAATPPV